MVTSSKGIDPLEIDQRITRLAFEAPGIAQADVIRGLIQQWTPSYVRQRITRLAFEAPGIAQADVIRGLIQQWTPSYVRQRIEILDARGTLRTERRGSRVHIYPAGSEAIEA